MANSDSDGCLAILIPIGYIVAWIGSGYTAYDWIEPHSFGGVLIFIVVWGIIGYVFQLILLGLFALLAETFK